MGRDDGTPTTRSDSGRAQGGTGDGSSTNPVAGDSADIVIGGGEGEDIVPVFDIFGDNTDWYKLFQEDEQSWTTNLGKLILGEMINAGNAIGMNSYTMTQYFSQNWTALLTDIDRELFKGNATSSAGRMIAAFDEQFKALGDTSGPMRFLNTPEGFRSMTDYARNWFMVRRPDLARAWETGVGGRGPSGGGGATGPSDDDIRGSFDLDQLAAGAQNVWRGTLLDDLKDPRGLAREYVERIVATGGKKKIDFDTFVRTKAEGTARFAAIYKNKPKGMNPIDYISPYIQSARSVLGPTKEAQGIALGGAMFGTSGPSFGARLSRTKTVTGSAPFISELENRLFSLRKVFKS